MNAEHKVDKKEKDKKMSSLIIDLFFSLLTKFQEGHSKKFLLILLKILCIPVKNMFKLKNNIFRNGKIS